MSSPGITNWSNVHQSTVSPQPTDDKPPHYTTVAPPHQQYASSPSPHPAPLVFQPQAYPGGPGQAPPLGVNTNRSVNVPPQRLGSLSTRVTCPNCKVEVNTYVTYSVGATAHLAAAAICAIGCCCILCWLCVWVPYCIPGFKDATHYCPQCKRIVGFHRR